MNDDRDTPATINVEHVQAALAQLPFEEFLCYWHRLTWWAAVWPLFQHLATIDLPLPDVFVLRMLGLRPLNVAEVAHMLNLSHSAASRAVDRLVSDELVSRREDPEDRRYKRLALTAKGQAKNRAVEAVFGAELDALITQLDATEQVTLQQLLARVVAASVELYKESPERTAWARALVAASAAVDDSARADNAGCEHVS